VDELQRRTEEGLEDGLDGDGLPFCPGFQGVEKAEAVLIDGLEHAAHDLEDEAILRDEVVIDRAQIGACLGGDGAQGGGLEAVGGEEPLRGIEDGGAGASASMLRGRRLRSGGGDNGDI
jgi:hypothetical protein